MQSHGDKFTRARPGTPEVQRVWAASPYRLDHDVLLPALAAHLGGTDGVFESTIRGESMSPAIPGGARLRVRLHPQPPFDRGDIVYYLCGEGFMVHRVMYRSRRDSWLITLGDNCLIPDLPVRVEQILGTVIAVGTGTGWRAPGPSEAFSVCHRLVRGTASAATVIALRCGYSTTCRLVKTLKWFESQLRKPIGRVLRRLHLSPSRS